MIHPVASHRHDPPCRLTLDLLFFLYPFTNSGLFIFAHTLKFPFLRAVYIPFFPPVSVSNNYTLALFIQETVGARTQFFRRSHIASFPPLSPVSAAACTLHYADKYGEVLYIACRLDCCCHFIVSFVILLFRNQEKQQENLKETKKQTNEANKDGKRRLEHMNFISKSRVPSILLFRSVWYVITKVSGRRAATVRNVAAVCSNCLRNLLVMCETPWRHGPKRHRSTDPFSWHTFLLRSAIRFPLLISVYLMTLYQLLSYISHFLRPPVAHSVRHTSHIPTLVIILGGPITPLEHQLGKLFMSTGTARFWGTI